MSLNMLPIIDTLMEIISDSNSSIAYNMFVPICWSDELLYELQRDKRNAQHELDHILYHGNDAYIPFSLDELIND